MRAEEFLIGPDLAQPEEWSVRLVETEMVAAINDRGKPNRDRSSISPERRVVELGPGGDFSIAQLTRESGCAGGQ
jgi:hypothetical protein